LARFSASTSVAGPLLSRYVEVCVQTNNVVIRKWVASLDLAIGSIRPGKLLLVSLAAPT